MNIVTEKRCSRCGALKPATNSYYSSDRRRWHFCQAQCKRCDAAGNRTHEARNRANSALKTEAQRARRAANMRAYRERPGNKLKGRARCELARAVERGTLQRGPCARCGAVDTQAHHHNGYTRAHWLDVEWLCVGCHHDEHRS